MLLYRQTIGAVTTAQVRSFFCHPHSIDFRPFRPAVLGYDILYRASHGKQRGHRMYMLHGVRGNLIAYACWCYISTWVIVVQGFDLGNTLYPASLSRRSSPSPPPAASKRRAVNRFSASQRVAPKFIMANVAVTASRRGLGKLLPASTVFFACDIQERFRDAIHNMPAVISTGRQVAGIYP